MKKLTAIFVWLLLLHALQPAAAYELQGNFTNLDNQLVPYSNFEGKITLIEGFATTCGICNNTHSQIAQVYNTYKNKITVASMGIFQSETLDRIRNYITVYPMPWVVGLDTERVLYNTFGWEGTPQIALLDEQGLTIATWSGYTTFDSMSATILSVLNNGSSTTTPSAPGFFSQGSILGDLFGSPIFQAGFVIVLVLLIYFKATGRKN